jgi:uncharacterized membrane protein
MQAAKFLLLGLTVVLMAVLGAAFGGYIWTRSVAPATVTAEELKRGGPYAQAEREALSAACATARDGTPVRCMCLTNRAGTDLSPFERRVATASLAGDAEALIGLSKGLMAARATPEQVRQAELGDNNRRIRILMTACGFPA